MQIRWTRPAADDLTRICDSVAPRLPAGILGFRIRRTAGLKPRHYKHHKHKNGAPLGAPLL